MFYKNKAQKQKFCLCNCGRMISGDKRYILGHNRKKPVDISKVSRFYDYKKMSLAEITQETGYSENLIKRCLRDGGVEVRSKEEAKEIAIEKKKLFFQSERGKRWLSALMQGHKFNRKLEYNRSFFKKPSRKMYYILGFIFADGCIGDNRRLIITIKDGRLLKKIVQAMGRKKNPRKLGKYFSLECNSIEMVGDLRSLGVVGHKTERLKPISIPRKYVSHFIRGYFDGDGCISFNKTLHKYTSCFSSSSRNFLEWVRNVLGIKSGCLRKCAPHCFELRFGEPDTIKLGWFIYKNLSIKRDIFLYRKWLRFKKLLDKNKIL